MNNIDFTNIENFESGILSDINIEEVLGVYNQISLMSVVDRQFINGIIRKTKPKKILELGVAAGSGTVLILNAIKDIPDSKLYSIDFLEKWWIDPNKNIGWIVEEKFNYLANKWEIYRGGTAARFMEKIGGDIDLCIIDTVHMNPGEILDFLIILPFLKKEAMLIIHDIQVHINTGMYHNKNTCCNLFSSLKGIKYMPSTDELYNIIPNIGLVILDKDIKEHIFDIFFLLSMNWDYNILEEDHNHILQLFTKYYGKDLIKTYEHLYLYNKTRSKLTYEFDNRINEFDNRINEFDNRINEFDNRINEQIYNIETKITKLIDVLAWWIPIKKWRDNFRDKFTRPDQTMN